MKMKTALVSGLALLGLAALTAAPARAQYLYIGDYTGHQVVRFDDRTGAMVAPTPFIATAGNTESIREYNGILLVADGDATTNRVTKYDVNTGARITGAGSQFTIGTALYDMQVAPDASRVYIAEDNQIAAYSLTDGSLLGSHATPNSWGVAINPATGEVYTGNGWRTGDNGVYKYSPDLTTQTTVVPRGDHGLTAVAGITFAKDGSFYVVNGGNADPTHSFVNHYKADGTFIRTLAAPGPDFLQAFAAGIGPDNNLYVASFSGPCVVRYDTTTDAFMDVFIPGHVTGLVSAKTLDFSSQRTTTVPEPGSVALLSGLGVCGAGLLRRRRK